MEIALLDEKKSIKQLVNKDINSSIVEFIRSELDKDEYSFIVTADNLKFAKDKMADLNKSIKFINDFRKSKVDAESVAIDTFKDNVKAYVALVDAKREEIKRDVEVFESETKASISKELALYSQELCKSQNIRDEFFGVDLSDLIVLGSATSKGALTKKARESVESRVSACKMKQDRYDMRLMKLENLSYQKGLKSPLTIVHVQGIVHLESDEEYEVKLNDLVSSELDRQNAVIAQMEKDATAKAEREAQQKILDKQDEIRKGLIIDCSYFDLDATDSYIASFMHTDYSSYNEYASYARSVSDQQIVKLQAHRKMLTDKAAKLLEDIEKDNGLVHEPVNVQPSMPSSDGKKIVRISAVWAIEVPSHISDDLVLDKVSKELDKRDAKGSSFESLLVV